MGIDCPNSNPNKICNLHSSEAMAAIVSKIEFASIAVKKAWKNLSFVCNPSLLLEIGLTGLPKMTTLSYKLLHDLWTVYDKTDCILLSDTSKFLLCLLFSAHKMVDPPCAPGRNPAWGDLENISIYSFVALEF